MKRFLVSFFSFITALCYCKSAFSQLDTVFWFVAPEVTESAGWGNFDRPIVFRISTLGQAATVTISLPAMPAIGPLTSSIGANSTGSIDVTSWIDLIETKPPNTILNGGIKVSSTAPVNIYYEVISGQNTSCQCSPEIFVLKGRNALGKDFIIPSQNILQNGTAYTPPSYNSFDLVATENNTMVTITPKAPIVGHAANVPFTMMLNKGQVFSNTATNFFPINHLTGSSVISDKPIAITVKDDMVQGPACWDLGGDQIIPLDNLSTEYIAIRGYLTSLTDHVFITAVNNNTSVTINGVAYATLSATQTIAVPFSAETMYITASNKVYAFQLSGFGCEIGLSTIPSIQCRGSSSVSFTRSSPADLILLVTTKAGNEGSFLLNGIPLATSSFSFVPATSNQWVYARLTIPVSQIPALSSGRLTNSSGLFHLGIIHGSTTSGGARFGYFSDYAAATLNVLQDTLIVCSANVQLDAGQGYTTYNWSTGASSQTINVTQDGLYKVSVTNTDGCIMSDSGYVNLQPYSVDSSSINLCPGQSFTLPWGPVVNATGIYRDTLRYPSGCDSIRKVIDLHIATLETNNTSAISCNGQPYTLPWGVTVNTSGIYRDTLRYVNGCDSVIRIINLIVESSLIVDSVGAVICEGSTYTLPWGTVVSTSGTYRDTVRYTTGCDSLQRIVKLRVQTYTPQFSSVTICAGSSYTLPWGTVVNTTGLYRDTLHYLTGCDSIIRMVNLTVQNFSTQVTNPVICEGSTYILPWGAIVSTAGIYHDTLHYTSGCDSIRRTVSLTVQNAIAATTNANICGGETYILPWGAVVNATGIYRDTLHYITGCDSIRRTVNLTVQSVTSQMTNAAICQGATYVLPWGAVVSAAGIYRDTLFYATGCDSVRTTVNLQVTAAAVSTVNATICSGEVYILPWGIVTNVAGIYKDTVRSLAACDSLIRIVNLTVGQTPLVSMSKSNDVDCILGTAKLLASGGVSYAWTPALSLNNAAIYNPVASPSATTWYKVLVMSDKGCTAEDSIEVKVIAGSMENGYLVPNAFTPNGDGKNDCFGVETWGAVTNFEFSIYSRWGERIFYSRDPRQCWDGTYKGIPQTANVFIYQIRAKGLCGDIYRKGTFALIR